MTHKANTSDQDKFYWQVFAFFAALMACPPTWAVFESVSSKLQLFADGLLTLGIPLTTISILIVAYKILFDGQSFKDCKNFLIGGTLAACATALGAAITAAS